MDEYLPKYKIVTKDGINYPISIPFDINGNFIDGECGEEDEKKPTIIFIHKEYVVKFNCKVR